jgi:hypothetical protein
MNLEHGFLQFDFPPTCQHFSFNAQTTGAPLTHLSCEYTSFCNYDFIALRNLTFSHQNNPLMSQPSCVDQDHAEPSDSKVDQRISKWGKLNRDATLNPFGFIDILKTEGGRPNTASETYDLWWDEGSQYNHKDIIDNRLEKSRFKH